MFVFSGPQPLLKSLYIRRGREVTSKKTVNVLDLSQVDGTYEWWTKTQVSPWPRFRKRFRARGGNKKNIWRNFFYGKLIPIK